MQSSNPSRLPQFIESLVSEMISPSKKQTIVTEGSQIPHNNDFYIVLQTQHCLSQKGGTKIKQKQFIQQERIFKCHIEYESQNHRKQLAGGLKCKILSISNTFSEYNNYKSKQQILLTRPLIMLRMFYRNKYWLRSRNLVLPQHVSQVNQQLRFASFFMLSRSYKFTTSEGHHEDKEDRNLAQDLNFAIQKKSIFQRSYTFHLLERQIIANPKQINISLVKIFLQSLDRDDPYRYNFLRLIQHCWPYISADPKIINSVIQFVVNKYSQRVNQLRAKQNKKQSEIKELITSIENNNNTIKQTSQVKKKIKDQQYTDYKIDDMKFELKIIQYNIETIYKNYVSILKWLKQQPNSNSYQKIISQIYQLIIKNKTFSESQNFLSVQNKFYLRKTPQNQDQTKPPNQTKYEETLPKEQSKTQQPKVQISKTQTHSQSTKQDPLRVKLKSQLQKLLQQELMYGYIIAQSGQSQLDKSMRTFFEEKSKITFDKNQTSPRYLYIINQHHKGHTLKELIMTNWKGLENFEIVLKLIKKLFWLLIQFSITEFNMIIPTLQNIIIDDTDNNLSSNGNILNKKSIKTDLNINMASFVTQLCLFTQQKTGIQEQNIQKLIPFVWKEDFEEQPQKGKETEKVFVLKRLNRIKQFISIVLFIICRRVGPFESLQQVQRILDREKLEMNRQQFIQIIGQSQKLYQEYLKPYQPLDYRKWTNYDSLQQRISNQGRITQFQNYLQLEKDTLLEIFQNSLTNSSPQTYQVQWGQLYNLLFIRNQSFTTSLQISPLIYYLCMIFDYPLNKQQYQKSATDSNPFVPPQLYFAYKFNIDFLRLSEMFDGKWFDCFQSPQQYRIFKFESSQQTNYQIQNKLKRKLQSDTEIMCLFENIRNAVLKRSQQLVEALLKSNKYDETQNQTSLNYIKKLEHVVCLLKYLQNFSQWIHSQTIQKKINFINGLLQQPFQNQNLQSQNPEKFEHLSKKYEENSLLYIIDSLDQFINRQSMQNA